MIETRASASSPIGALKELVAQSERVARAEMRLVLAEYTSRASIGARLVGVLVTGSVLACFAFGYVLYAAYLSLLQVLAPWQAALAIGAVLSAMSGILFAAGRSGAGGGNLVPTPDTRSHSTRDTDD